MVSRKSDKGFSLVEVIVVGVIVAILSVVAIPRYMAYLNETRQQAVDQLAQTAASAANNLWRRTGIDPAGVAELNLFYDAAKFTVTLAPPNVTVTLITPAGFTKTVAFR